MSALDRTTLKALFQNGDVPSGSDYGDMIDSAANLAETAAQTFQGAVNFAAGFSAATVGGTNIAGTNVSGTNLNAGSANVTNMLVSGATFASGATVTFNAAPTFKQNFSVSAFPLYKMEASIACISTAQASARLLTAVFNVIKTVATGANDSVVLPGGYPRAVQFIINTTTASAKVFPPSGGAIDGGSTNAARDIGPSSRVLVFHEASGTFYTLRGS